MFCAMQALVFTVITVLTTIAGAEPVTKPEDEECNGGWY
jgi:hypothetical protein